MLNDVTLCLTMGGRPDLLKDSLLTIADKYKFNKVIAINDFLDARCDVVFKEIFPDGLLISDGIKRGHHAAINKLYEEVETEFIFHTEDDWIFTKEIRFDEIKDLLRARPDIISYCFREVTSFLKEDELENIKKENYKNLEINNLSMVHAEWYSYTFNPHIILRETVKIIGDFSKYKKERHVSRSLKAAKKFVAYANPGICEHIGEQVSMANPNANKKKSRLRVWMREKINSFKKVFDTQS